MLSNLPAEKLEAILLLYQLSWPINKISVAMSLTPSTIKQVITQGVTQEPTD